MDSNTLHEEIYEVLQHFDTQVDPILPDGNQEGIEVIDIYIVRHVEEAEPSIVEGTLNIPPNEQETEQQTPVEQEASTGQETDEPGLSPRIRKAHFRVLPFVVGALCVLLACTLALLSLLTLLAPSATVTIIPTATRIIATRTVIVVVGSNANSALHQIPGRQLATVTWSQAQTVPTTGTGHQLAQAARGIIILYNALPAPQFIPAGELLTGADGIQVVTEEDATIPAAQLPVDGQVSVEGRALNIGPGGNIHAGDIYGPCCRENVFAVNGAFRGGQDARTYGMVAQQDLNEAATSLKTSLDLSAQAALRLQVHGDETLIPPWPCTSTVTADHRAGEEATKLHVTVEMTCTGEVYNTNAFHHQAIQIINEEAIRRLGEGYSLSGDIQATITRTMPKKDGAVEMMVHYEGTWVYQFTQEQLQRIKTIIVGKSKQEAITLLLATSGIQTVAVTFKNGNTFPTDPEKIHVVVLEMI
jgi:hypothetical protein